MSGVARKSPRRRRKRSGSVCADTIPLFWKVAHLLLVICFSLVTASDVLDLSYRPHLSIKSVSAAVTQALAQDRSDAKTEAKANRILFVDVSSSNLGDDGLREMIL